MRERDHFQQYQSDASWQVYTSGWVPEAQNLRESQFVLGNGYLGSRGVLEEHPSGSYPGTYFAGLFDRTLSGIPDMVNAPNPMDCRLSVNREPLSVETMAVSDHGRVLDMQKAFLKRRTHFVSKQGHEYHYQSMRFFSLADKHVAVMRLYLTPMSRSAVIHVDALVNRKVTNKGAKPAFVIDTQEAHAQTAYLCVRTLEKETRIAYATSLQVELGKQRYCVAEKEHGIRVKKGETLCLTQYISLATTQECPKEKLRAHVLHGVAQAKKQGFDRLFDQHSQAWQARWAKADIRISGDEDSERALRFNNYHLLITGNTHATTGIGAKTLSGEGYRGHSFWDTELFVLPYFTFNFPDIARNLLLYRYHRLPQACEKAGKNGYSGAMFPWESADTGEEVTPEWHRDFDGTLKKITTGIMEHHITADVAYGVYQYYIVTHDETFMLRYGLEMILQTARFWASRVTWNKRRRCYEINDVIGPDEFHEGVDNNAFTNRMASWNLETAAQLYRQLKSKHMQAVKKISTKIDLLVKEPTLWQRIAKQIPICVKGDLVEAFEGYFKCRDLPLTPVNDYFMPTLPDMPSKTLETTQYVKQADVMMLIFLLESEFSTEQIKANYHYYERRTLHKSSLSPAIHALVAARQGDEGQAKRYFNASVMTDLKDVHENTAEGMHAASLGGTWQAVVLGFAGIRIEKGVLILEPHLPERWGKLTFGITLFGKFLRISISKTEVCLKWETKQKQGSMKVKICGKMKTLRMNTVLRVKVG